jgi:hypothetical protein
MDSAGLGSIMGLSTAEALKAIGQAPSGALTTEQALKAIQQQPAPQQPPASFYDRLRESLMGGLAGPVQAFPKFEAQVMNSVNKTAMTVPDMIPNLVNAVSSEVNRFQNVQQMDNYDPNSGEPYSGYTQAPQVPTVQGAAGEFGIGNQNYLPEGAARTAADTMGMGIFAAGGAVPVAARNVGTLPGAIAEFAGIGSKAPLAASTAAADEALPSLIRQSGDDAAAGFKLEPVVKPGVLNTTDQGLFDAGLLSRSVADPIQKEALKQVFEPADVSFIAQMNEATRQKALQMFEMVKAGKRNVMNRYERPSRVVGGSMMDRVNVVRKANKVAGTRLGAIAEKLKGKPVDITDAQTEFDRILAREKVAINPVTKELDFSRSNMEGYSGAQDLLARVYRRLNEATAGGSAKADAYLSHELKRFIDKQVTFGKQLDGISGDTESMLKGLRRNIDTALDSTYDQYNRVNTHYSTTVQALDELQSSLGARMDFNAEYADKSAGTAMRKVLTNYQTAPEIEQAFSSVENLARKYITESDDIIDAAKIRQSTGINALDDNVLEQVALVDRFNKIFGTAPAGSMEGIQTGAAQRTAELIRNPENLAITWVDKNLQKMRGINEKNALKAMEALIRGRQ